MSLALIAAVAKNNCIGNNNALPWHLPEDLRHFKELTFGKTVLMGRKTWESIPAKFRPLPGRKNIVITSQTDYPLPDAVEKFTSIPAALTMHANDTVYVMGGAEIYKQTINQADTLFLTEIHHDVAGDVFFPIVDPTQWRETAREDHDTFSFVTYTRYA